MDVRKLLEEFDRFAGTQQTVEGLLIENARRPFLAERTQDWHTGRYLLLSDNGLFDVLYDAIFPEIIGGGSTGFLYPAVAVGCVERNPNNGICSLHDLKTIQINARGKEIVLRGPFWGP